MRKCACALVLAALALTLAAAAALAETPKTYAVLPFAVHGPDKYAHLSQGIQSMLVSRLSWPEHFQPLDQAAVGKAGASVPQTRKQALDTLTAVGADYLVYGSVTILNDDASLDVQALSKDGKSWPMSRTGKLDALIPSLEEVAAEINAEIFKKPGAQAAASKKERIQVINPDLVYNEADTRQEFYLNPQFRYEGSESSEGRWRSQSLPFASLGMAIGDADHDGTDEVFILGDDDKVHAYRFVERRLDPVGEYAIPRRLKPLRLSMLDLDRDGTPEIIVSNITDDDEQLPWGTILNFTGKQFNVVADSLRYFLNVVQTPPEYTDTLVGQRRGDLDPLKEPVYEMLKNGSTLTQGKRLNLPPWGNAFNFGFYPEAGRDLTLYADSFDRLRTYTPEGDLLSTTGEAYANSWIGVDVNIRFPGMGLETKDERRVDSYHIPMRMLVTKLATDKRWELIVGRNISTSAEFFERYRNYPYSEIHSLYWDGVGMSVFWKTRRLKGTVVDYALADLNGDGRKDLCVLLNTHAGMAGVENRRTVLLGYELDLGRPKDSQTGSTE